MIKQLAQLDYREASARPWHVTVWGVDGKRVEYFETCVDAEIWINSNGYEMDCP